MRQSKIFMPIQPACYIVLSATTLCFVMPGYAQNNILAKEATNTPVVDTSVDKARPNKLAIAQPAEVKDQGAALHGKASAEKEKPKIDRAKSRSPRKMAVEQMSSDDTTKEYAAAINPDAHYEKARILAMQQKYNGALREVNEALIQNPHFYEARYLGAVIYQKQGRKQEAARKLKQLLMYKPSYLQARISYGMVLSELGQVQAAEAEYRKAIDLSYISVEPHYDLANLLTKQGRLKEAMQELRICLKLAPDNAAVHNNLGVIYYHQHYIEESEKEFRQASELDPANTIYQHNLEIIRAGDKSIEAPSLG